MPVPVNVRSFAKINLGLYIGARRIDGFHDLLTVYQTIALHDLIRVTVARGSGIDIRCADPRVPNNETNTCYRIAEIAMRSLKANGRVVIEIEKKLPVQGGLGGASSNAVAVLLAIERALKKNLSLEDRLRITAQVGSDLPLFLTGGSVLGLGRGEQVYPLPDLKPIPCVILIPQVGISTPKAFAAWDRIAGADAPEKPKEVQSANRVKKSGLFEVAKLTLSKPSDRMKQLGARLSAWLSESYSGAPFRRGRRENPLLELVRAGIKNDFEEVVFPEYPELSVCKRALEHAGAKYASLSGSGSTLYGLFGSSRQARIAAQRLKKQNPDWTIRATSTLTRAAYWKRFWH